jgi:RND family efflux transporter MFP subunit
MGMKNIISKILTGFIAAIYLITLNGCSSTLASSDSTGTSQDTNTAAEETIRVKTASVQIRTFVERVEVQGSLTAKNYANVTARIPGTIVGIYVNEGDAVTAGITKLFEIDSVNLRNALEISRQDYALAEQGVIVAEASLDQVNTQLNKAEIDLNRLTRLFENEIVTRDALERAQAGYDHIVSAKVQASSAVTLAEERVRQAEIALNIGEKNLSDATIYAPISGSVANRSLEVGEMAAPGMPVIRIEDTSLLEASAFLPAEIYGRIIQGETTVQLSVFDNSLEDNTISYKSPTINPTFRTFEVKAIISDPPSGVVPGAMVNFTVILSQKQSLGVPSASIQDRDNKDVVFIALDGKAVMRIVETGLETDGYTEITGGDINQGDYVIMEGQSFLNEGSMVLVNEEIE